MKSFSGHIESPVVVKLDSFDRKIISYLALNARIPHNKLAKLVSLSRQNIAYRIQKLQKSRVFVSSKTIIDTEMFGFHKYHYFVNIPTKSEQISFLNRCIEHTNVNAILTYSGKWNVEVSIMAKSQWDCYTVFNTLSENIHIMNYSVTTLIQTITNRVLPDLEGTHIPTNYQNDTSFIKDFGKSYLAYTPNDTDFRILKYISDDASLTLTQIAKKCAISNDAVKEHIKKLIHSKHILAFVPQIDFETLGYSITVMTISVASHNGDNYKAFNDFLRANPTILWAASCLGDWNYIVYLMHTNTQEIHQFVMLLNETFGKFVLQYELLYAEKQYKYLYAAPAIFNR